MWNLFRHKKVDRYSDPVSRVINGKMYDTRTSELVCSDPITSGCYKPYASYLYRTQSGEFFLVKVGYFKGSERNIEILNWFNAREYTKKYANDETYQNIFGAGVTVSKANLQGIRYIISN